MSDNICEYCGLPQDVPIWDKEHHAKVAALISAVAELAPEMNAVRRASRHTGPVMLSRTKLTNIMNAFLEVHK